MIYYFLSGSQYLALHICKGLSEKVFGKVEYQPKRCTYTVIFGALRLNPNRIMLLIRKPIKGHKAHNIGELQEIMLGTCNNHNSTCQMCPVGHEDELS